MSVTLNGWPVITSPGATRPGPDNLSDSGFANDDVADVLTAVMWWWHTELEPVTQWGGHRKPDFNASLANAATRSNHLSGTAQDINWTKHPFIKSRTPGSSFTAAQHALLREFDARVNGIIRWGWTFTDEMHSEIEPGTTPAQVATAAAKVRLTFVPWRTSEAIRVAQRRIGTRDDGLWGPGAVAACRAKQGVWGVPRTGLWDVATHGAYRDRVTVLQPVAGQLARLGYTGVTGVGAYQRTNGLTVDELVGPNTRTRIGADMATLDQIEKRIISLQESVNEVNRDTRLGTVHSDLAARLTATTDAIRGDLTALAGAVGAVPAAAGAEADSETYQLVRKVAVAITAVNRRLDDLTTKGQS